MKDQEDSISSRDYQHLCKLIHAKAGIALGSEKKTMLEARLRRRLKDLTLGSYCEYCDYLFGKEGMRDEIVHLIDVVTTNKTDFFREQKHFDFLAGRALPEFAARNGKWNGLGRAWHAAGIAAACRHEGSEQ
jgi:chemotaxis protein methyltransferase CheR